MKFKKLASALAMIGAVTFGTSAYADPTITNLDGNLTPFGGFDWASGAAAWTSGYLGGIGPTGGVGTTFTLYYAATAGAVVQTNGVNFTTGRLDTSADGVSNSVLQTLGFSPNSYEYTIFASLTETITGCNATFTTCTFQVTGGSFDIYYDVAADGKQSTGVGYLNGTKIIGGSVNAGASPNSFDNATGGQATLAGTVSYTNSAYVNPALVGTNLTSTLQLSSAVTNFTVPSGFDFNNDGIATALSNGTPGQVIVFQADANQTFSTTKVPEPGSLALVGAALLAGGALTRRRKNNV